MMPSRDRVLKAAFNLGVLTTARALYAATRRLHRPSVTPKVPLFAAGPIRRAIVISEPLTWARQQHTDGFPSY